jgi:hypothetical protein
MAHETHTEELSVPGALPGRCASRAGIQGQCWAPAPMASSRLRAQMRS